MSSGTAAEAARRDALVTPEEKLEDLRRRYALLEGDRRAYYESSQWTIKVNRDNLSVLRRERDALALRLQEVKAVSEHRAGSLAVGRAYDADTPTGRVPIESYRKLADVVHALQRQLDAARDETARLQLEAESVSDDVDYLDLQAASARTEAVHARRIRALENRLDKAMIKYNEAVSIRKTYEGIASKLESEKITRPNELETIEKLLKEKDAEIAEIRTLARDAAHAEASSRAELARVEKDTASTRASREAEITERRGEVARRRQQAAERERRARQDGGNAGEASGDGGDGGQDSSGAQARGSRGGGRSGGESGGVSEDAARKIGTYEEAFRRLRGACGLEDINDIIQKFMSQDDTHDNLVKLSKDAERRIAHLTEECNRARATLEEIKFSASGQAGSRRIVDEFSAQLVHTKRELEANEEKFTRLNRTYVNSKAGIEHLAGKLEAVVLDHPVPTSKNEDEVVDLLTVCEHKLLRVLEEIRGAGETPVPSTGARHPADAGIAVPAQSPAGRSGTAPKPAVPEVSRNAQAIPNNTRVVLYGDEEDSDIESSDDEDVSVLDREAVKKNAQAVLSQQEKGKRKGRRVKGR